MTCDLYIYVNPLKRGERISVANELAIEHLIRNRCDILKELEVLYNKYCVRKDQMKRDAADPTVQEEDKKSIK